MSGHSEVQGQGGAPATSASGSRRTALSRRKRLVFALVTLVLGWVVLEVGAFVLYGLFAGQLFSWSAYQKMRREVEQKPMEQTSAVASVHPYVGYVETPGGESGVHALLGSPSVPINEFGYIDEKSPVQKRGADRVVVGITGGSVASYFAVLGTEVLEAELSKSPRFAGKRFVFVNLALGGYKQPQQLMTLSYLLSLGAEFDLILNIDGFNEVALYELENASRHVFPAYPRNWAGRVGGAPQLGAARARMLVLLERRAELARGCSRLPWRYSVLANLAWRLRDRRLEAESYQATRRYYETQGHHIPYAVTGPRWDFDDRQALYEFLADVWSHSSIQMDRLCAGNGIGYYHFLQPNQYLAGSKPMGQSERKAAIVPGHPYQAAVETGYPLLIRKGRELARQGVAYQDLTGAFADHPEPIYSDTCCHYHRIGYEIVARSIARAILEDPRPR